MIYGKAGLAGFPRDTKPARFPNTALLEIKDAQDGVQDREFSPPYSNISDR